MVMDRQQADWQAHCQGLLQQIGCREATWLKDWRHQHLEQALALSFPNRRHEIWRYTDMTAWRSADLSLSLPLEALRAYQNTIHKETVLAQLLKMPSVYRAVFYNGHLQQTHTQDLPSQAIISNWTTLLQQNPELVQDICTRLQYKESAQLFKSLNYALMQDGLLIYLPKGVQLKQPIVMVSLHKVGEKSTAPTLSCNQHWIYLEEGAKAVVWQVSIGLDAQNNIAYYHNVATDIQLARGAQLTHYQLQSHTQQAQHLSMQRVELQRDSQLEQHSIALGGRLARQEDQIILQGEGAQACVSGLTVTMGCQQVDHDLNIQHIAPHTTSKTTCKAIAAQRSKSVFKGGIHICPHAHGTQAHLQNTNLLLDPTAEINTKPELNIENNDVQCSHGAVVGSVDQEAKHYLQSRGLSKQEAYRLLVNAFAKDRLQAIHHPSIYSVTEQMTLDKLTRIAELNLS